MPLKETNFAPRVGIGYALGSERPLMVRAGFGIFYTRIPQIYQSAVINDNGLSDNFISLDNTNFYQEPGLSHLSECGGELPARAGLVHHTSVVAAVCDQRGVGICAGL